LDISLHFLHSLVLMAKRLRLFFVALLIVAFAIFGYLNIWQFFTSRSVGTPMISYNSSVVSVLVLQNSESRNVVENSYELSVKKTRERMWELIVERLRTINDTSRQWHKHHATDHSLSTPNAFASGFESSLSSSKAVTPRPNSVQFHHASDAVRSWNSGSNHAVVLADLPSINVSSVNCTALIHGDKKELRYARRFQATHTKEKVMAMKFVQQASNCTQFVAERHYVTSPVNREEAEFRIAFSILMFKDVEQFERLLRAIYRPQNFYCIHVDNKSSSEIHTAVNMIAHCFENVFVLQRSFDVRWGTFSVLEPELACMKRLLRRSKKWKYFINLTGQEFPLKTNWQIVRILKAFNGSNNMEGTIKRFVLLKIWCDIARAMPFNLSETPNNGNVNINISVAVIINYYYYYRQQSQDHSQFHMSSRHNNLPADW